MMGLKLLVTDTDGVAEKMLGFWEHDGGTLRFWRASSNFVYAFELGGKRYFMRFSHASENSLEQLEAEMEFVEFLAGRGYGCARALPSKNGRILETLDTDLGRWYGVVFEGQDGLSLDADGMDDEMFFHWGKALGNLHLLSAEYVPSKSPRKSWRDHLEMTESVLARFPEESAARAELGRIREWLENLPAPADEYGLIHYDFEADNLFFGREKVGVIDFDDAMYHWFAADVAVSAADAGQNGKESFLSGYLSVKNTAERFFDAVPRFERFSNLVKFSRLLRSLEDGDFEEEPDWLANLRPKLAGKLEDLRISFAVPF